MKQPNQPLLLPLLFLFLSLLSALDVSTAADTSRSINIMNQSGRRVDIHWVHPDTGERVLQSTPDVLNGASFDLNSYVGHAFSVKELPAKKTKVCYGEGGTCREDNFTVNANLNQVIFIREGITVVHSDSKTIANDAASALLEDCKSAAKRRLSHDADPAKVVLDGFAECVRGGVAREMGTVDEEVAFQAGIRETMAGAWESYTCADRDPKGVNATEAKRTEYWDQEGGDHGNGRKRKGRAKKVEVMLDRPSSKVHVIEDFVTAEECRALEGAAGLLGEEGWARIAFDPSRGSGDDPIARVDRRVYDYVSHALPLEIGGDGQEGPVWRVRDPDDWPSGPSARDGGGRAPRPGDAAAAVVVHCTAPAAGGATNFRNAGVRIEPKELSATFVGLVDPEGTRTDDGLAERSSCPVLEGEEATATWRVRLGVDAESPWSSFED